MVQTRSQTKKHEEEEEVECMITRRSNGWSLIFDNDSNYYVITDNYYNETCDNYHAFKVKDYGVIMAYRKAIKCFHDKVGQCV